ncbi:MAG: Mur ligase domain-containing protein [Nibricoccus sp.]
MDSTSFKKIARWCRRQLVAGDPHGTVTNVCTDSRALKAGDLFVALRGEKFDAHTFIGEAAKRGAAGAIVEEVSGGSARGFCGRSR